MFSRKNDGTVKMTRQRATSKTGLLGMTGRKGTLAEYLKTAGEKTPREAAAERLKQLSAAEEVGQCVTYQQDSAVTFKLCFRGSTYWWVRKQAHGTSRSLRYRGKSRALLAFERNRVIWIEFFPAGEEINDCSLPWTSWNPPKT